MDKIFDTLLTWQFLMFCLGIAAITSVIRSGFEYAMKNNSKIRKIKSFWEELVLPVMPIFLGSLIGWLAVKYPYPGDIAASSGRVFFGMTAGLLSGLVYRLLKSLLLSNIKGTEDPNDNLINSVKSKLLKNNQ